MNEHDPASAIRLPKCIEGRRAVAAYFLKSSNRRYSAIPLDYGRHDDLTLISFREGTNADGSFWVNLYVVFGAQPLASNSELLLDEAFCKGLWTYFDKEADRARQWHRSAEFRQSRRFAAFERLLVRADGSADLAASEVTNNGYCWGFDR